MFLKEHSDFFGETSLWAGEKKGREGKKGVKMLPQSSREEGWLLGLRWAWWDVARKSGR